MQDLVEHDTQLRIYIKDKVNIYYFNI